MKSLRIIIGIFMLMACSAPQQLQVTHVQDLAQFPEQTSIYVLPRTRLAVSIRAVRYITVPGPYRNYAAEYLGIQGVPEFSETSWQIDHISLTPVAEPDPDYYYALTASDFEGQGQVLNRLHEQGYILMPADMPASVFFNPALRDVPEPIHFTDLSVKRFVDTRTSDRPKARERADVSVDLPVTRQDEAGETIREKAEQAAAFIIKIRKRRFKLLAGQYDVFPEGQALETSVRELNRLEEEYLSLFIGKTYADTLEQSYYYSPAFGQEIERHEICRFSEETGFTDAPGTVGKPVVIDIRNLHYTGALKQVRLTSSGPTHRNTILYRIPDKAFVRIIYGSTTALEAELGIYQYGAVVPYIVQDK